MYGEKKFITPKNPKGGTLILSYSGVDSSTNGVSGGGLLGDSFKGEDLPIAEIKRWISGNSLPYPGPHSKERLRKKKFCWKREKKKRFALSASVKILFFYLSKYVGGIKEGTL